MGTSFALARARVVFSKAEAAPDRSSQPAAQRQCILWVAGWGSGPAPSL